MCEVVSDACLHLPHMWQFARPCLNKCPFKWQSPVSNTVIILSRFLLRLNNSSAFFAGLFKTALSLPLSTHGLQMLLAFSAHPVPVHPPSNTGRYIKCKVYISRPTRCTNSYNEFLLIIKHSTCFRLLSPSSGVTFCVCLIMVYLYTHCNMLHSAYNVKPSASSGPMSGCEKPSLANWSATSFPSILTCPGTHSSWILLCPASFTRDWSQS